MARITLDDGTIHEVDYNVAAEVNEIRLGVRKPKNPRQAAYAKRVTRVDFDTPVPTTTPQGHGAYDPNKHDEDMAKVLLDPKLKGAAKMRAVLQRIKERRTAK